MAAIRGSTVIVTLLAVTSVKKVLHMNPHGTGKLAINFIKMLKKLYLVSETTPPSCRSNTSIGKIPNIPIAASNHTCQSKYIDIIHKREGVVSDQTPSNLNINAKSFILHHNIYPIAYTSTPHTTHHTFFLPNAKYFYDTLMAFSTTGLVNTHVIFVFRHGKHLMY